MAAYGRKRVAEATRKVRREEAVRIWRQRQDLMSPGTVVLMPDGTNRRSGALSLKQANHILAKAYGFGSTRKAAESFDRSLRRDLPRKKRMASSFFRDHHPPVDWEWDMDS